MKRIVCLFRGHNVGISFVREEGPYRFTFFRCLRCGADGPTMTESSRAAVQPTAVKGQWVTECRGCHIKAEHGGGKPFYAVCHHYPEDPGGQQDVVLTPVWGPR